MASNLGNQEANDKECQTLNSQSKINRVIIPDAVITEVKANLLEICSKKELPDAEYKRLLGISASRILSFEGIKKNFSKDEIRDKLVEIIQSSKTAADGNIDQAIGKALQDFDKALDYQIGDWRFVLPIVNITISQELKIGKVRLFLFTQEDANTMEKYEKELFKENTYYNEKDKAAIIKSMVEKCVIPLVGKTCADLELSGREKRTHDIALDEISKALSLIKLFCDIDDTFGQYFGLPGEIAPSTNRLTLAYRVDGKGFSPSWERIGPLIPFTLDSERLNLMKSNGVQKLIDLFNKEDKDDLDTRILTSINWYGKAYDVRTTRKGDDKTVEVEMIKLSDKLVKITTAIESLLIFNEQEPITNAVSERSASLLALNKKEFDEIRKFMSDMYSARSAIVHHGKMSFTKKDLDKFQYFVRNAIICLINNMDSWGLRNENDFFYWIEKERIEFRYDKHPQRIV